jgi:hypothetical protein
VSRALETGDVSEAVSNDEREHVGVE